MACVEGNLNDLSQSDSFVDTTEEELTELLEGSKSKNTNKSTKSALTQFKSFLKVHNLPDIEDLDLEIF